MLAEVAVLVVLLVGGLLLVPFRVLVPFITKFDVLAEVAVLVVLLVGSGAPC